MTKKKKLTLLAAAAILLVVLCVCLVSCFGAKNEPGAASSIPDSGEPMTFTVVLSTEGGKALEGVGIYFYTDSSLQELLWFAKTDAEGKVSFTEAASSHYVAVLDNPPAGYKVEPYYPLTDATTEIILSTDMADGDLANITYNLGDVMMNFSVTDAYGKTYVLSDLLAEKQAVVLNFWYLECKPCQAEFPYLQEAYENYSDKIALIAMNPINEDNQAIATFAVENGLTFPMLHCDPAWAQAMQLTAYPTTVIIDRFGTIALIHTGSIDDAKTFEDAFEFFTAEDYEQTTVENIEDLEILAAGASSDNPIELGGELAVKFEVTLEPGQMAYYHLYKVDGMTLTVDNKDVYAVYNDRTYEPKNGRIEFTVSCQDTYTPCAVAFGNSGEETETFTVRLTAKPGTVDNPYAAALGDFTVKVSAGNDQGVYYTYTPKQDGRLTVQCTEISPAGVEYGISLTTQKGSATVQRTMEEDGDTGTGTVSIPVTKGVKVQIVISTLPDKTNAYPAGTLKCNLAIGEDTGDEDEALEKITYAVTVTDANRNPLSGVFLNVKTAEAASEAAGESTDTSTGVSVNISTNDKGVATTIQDAVDYDVVVTLPVGYTAATTAFRLTAEQPYASIKLDELVVEKKTYTVTVTDVEGNPLSGAMVTIGTAFATTDDTGKVSLELPKAAYTVYITPPKGYVAETGGYPFEGESLSMTVSLEEGTSDDSGTTGKADYTVTVVDYSGNAQSGVMVQILSDGAPVSAQQTDSTGTVTATLDSADYTVALAFSGTQLYYEPKLAVLPAGTTELTIKVAPAVSDETKTYYYGTVRYLNVGGNYAQLQSSVVNYFFFNTQEAGLYKITTSDPDVVISYWGGNTFYIPQVPNEEGDSYELNVKESYIPSDGQFTAIFGFTGADDCIIEVIRVGDPILDENDIVAEVYEATTKPTASAGKITATIGKKLTYVDLAGKTSDYTIVKGSDGYYHLNSATGPLLYMNIGPNAPYHSLYYMAGYGGNGVAGTGIKATIYDENGRAVKKWDFSECMLSYGACADPTYGVYPLTEDLVFIVQTAGAYYGWWDSTSANFWLEGADGLNPELGWMFAVCYVP